jgi:hypothetical protein
MVGSANSHGQTACFDVGAVNGKNNVDVVPRRPVPKPARTPMGGHVPNGFRRDGHASPARVNPPFGIGSHVLDRPFKTNAEASAKATKPRLTIRMWSHGAKELHANIITQLRPRGVIAGALKTP